MDLTIIHHIYYKLQSHTSLQDHRWNKKITHKFLSKIKKILTWTLHHAIGRAPPPAGRPGAQPPHAAVPASVLRVGENMKRISREEKEGEERMRKR
jgi:hypothetical protein